MAEEVQTVHLRNDFYRDGFYKALTAFFMLLAAIMLLVAASLYLLFSKPAPVVFTTGVEFRTVAPVSLNQPYLKQPDLIQWISEAIPAAFAYDFVNYPQQVRTAMQYFTANGWKNFADILKIYADYGAIANAKIFVKATPAGAPFILNQGLVLGGIYGWWIQMPITLSYSGAAKGASIPLVVQVLMVRISMINNLSGVAIEKMIVTKGGGNQANANG